MKPSVTVSVSLTAHECRAMYTHALGHVAKLEKKQQTDDIAAKLATWRSVRDKMDAVMQTVKAAEG